LLFSLPQDALRQKIVPQNEHPSSVTAHVKAEMTNLLYFRSLRSSMNSD
jgi:hypothetical protein